MPKKTLAKKKATQPKKKAIKASKKQKRKEAAAFSQPEFTFKSYGTDEFDFDKEADDIMTPEQPGFLKGAYTRVKDVVNARMTRVGYATAEIIEYYPVLSYLGLIALLFLAFSLGYSHGFTKGFMIR